MAYIDQTYFENYIGRSLTTQEAAIFASVLAAAQIYIDSILGTTYEDIDEESTKYYDGQDIRRTYQTISIDPVKEISKVAIVDAQGDESTVLESDGSSYIARPLNQNVKTYLERRGGAWEGGRKNIAVTGLFTSFDGAVPDNIQLAAAMLLQDFFESQQTGELQSESIEGYSRTFASGSTSSSSRLDQVKALLLAAGGDVLI